MPFFELMDKAYLTSNIATYSTGDKTSFAWVTARERWPIIIVSGPPLPDFGAPTCRIANIRLSAPDKCR